MFRSELKIIITSPAKFNQLIGLNRGKGITSKREIIKKILSTEKKVMVKTLGQSLGEAMAEVFVTRPTETLHRIQKHLGHEQKMVVFNRILTTVLFTDIVNSTKMAAEMGDSKWSDLLEAHHQAVRKSLKLFRGQEVKTTGDGFHAIFDSPARAIQCASAIRASTRQLGLDLRVGIHTGECEVRGNSLEGLTIHIAARISSIADGGDILVSRTVKDLVSGSRIDFEDIGIHELKGIADDYKIFKVSSVSL